MASNDSVLSLFLGETEAYFFDRAGRPFAAWDNGWFVSLGLSGRCVARRWLDGRREVRTLTPLKTDRLEAAGRRALQKAMNGAGSDQKNWIDLALGYDRSRDIARFRKVYRPIGILPPDQYGACLLQITEGCGWNQCHFCSFYSRQPYRLKTRAGIKDHIGHVGAFFAEGLSRRRSIFLGEANAMGAPVDLLLYGMETARRTLVPKMPQFRGFYSFHEGTAHSRHTIYDLRILARAGLKRVYFGLETGQAELRKRLGKPGALEILAETITNTKAAGVKVAVIVLAGPGGLTWAERHTQETLRFIKGLPLNQADMVYLSPLYGKDGTAEPPMGKAQIEAQMTRLRRGLAPQVLVAPYDIREFVY